MGTTVNKLKSFPLLVRLHHCPSKGFCLLLSKISTSNHELFFLLLKEPEVPTDHLL